MRLLFLTWNFPPNVGGIEYLVSNLWSGLRARGHALDVVTSHATMSGHADSCVHRCPIRGLAGFVAYSLLRGFRQCAQRRPDVILCGSVVSAPAGWLLSRLFRRPWAMISYGSDVVHGGGLYQRVVRFLFRRADLLLPISTHTATLLEAAGADAGRMVIIPPGVNTDAFRAPPSPRDPEVARMVEGRRVLLSVGRLIPRKGVRPFVEHAMPELARRFPDILLVLIGEDAGASLIHRGGESVRGQIEQAVAARNLGRNVMLPGKVPDDRLLQWYYAAQLFILPVIETPGDTEGFGIVFSEAALAGMPIVASRCGGIIDAVEDGVSGILVPPGDYPAMIEAIAGLLSDEPRRIRMGEAAGARARRLFSWDTVVPQYEQALSALSRRGGIPSGADHPHP
ncbi:MAG: glycosyltransferase family 4 protein [Kiritimatiellae bacterium]|nr:glycosyltransferase family 4 protein [Kiritimatiellia bacterium]